MPAFDRQAYMGAHRLAVIAAGQQGDAVPEIRQQLEMRFPVGDAGLEDRAEKRIGADAAVEA